jgi:chemotaxis methyl-accepting protein methylase
VKDADCVALLQWGLPRLGLRWRGFRAQDIRLEQPPGPFDLVLCRNLAFTYFDEPLQSTIVERIGARTRAGGFLVLGRHEALPGNELFGPKAPALGIHQRLA